MALRLSAHDMIPALFEFLLHTEHYQEVGTRVAPTFGSEDGMEIPLIHLLATGLEQVT